MELLLIRHAQTHSNVVRALDTDHPGADLTELGEQQAAELAQALAHERVDAVYVSPRLRTRRTAQGLLDSRDLDQPVLRPGLVEVDAGDWEMSTVEEHADAYNRTVSAWVAGDLAAGIPGGEDGHAAIGRFDAVIEEILAAGLDRVAVVSHGAILRGWCGVRVANVGAELATTHPLRNTGLIRLRGGDAGPDDFTATLWDEQVVETGGEAGAAADVPDGPA